MAKKYTCQFCGGLLIDNSPENCPMNHTIPDELKIVAIRDISLTSGKKLTIPKGTEGMIEAAGGINVKFWWRHETEGMQKNTIGWEGNVKRVSEVAA